MAVQLKIVTGFSLMRACIDDLAGLVKAHGNVSNPIRAAKDEIEHFFERPEAWFVTSYTTYGGIIVVTAVPSSELVALTSFLRAGI